MPAPNPIRLVLVDDQTIILEGLAALLEGDDAFEVVGTAASGEQAVKAALRTEPDAVIMDISMPPGISGIDATREIKRRMPDVKVLMLSMYHKADLIAEALAAGASGYLLKNTGRKELKEALRTIVDDGTYLSEGAQDDLSAQKREQPQGQPILSKREREVLRLVAQQRTSQEIADALHLSVLTVETHRKNIHQKLGVHGTAGLLKYAVDRGWHL
jgi:two-component system nitrate/nitrite response regulator NarL